MATWGELRMTRSFLIVGYHRTARRIPLDGLEATATETGAPGDAPGTHRLLLTITGLDGEAIQRSQPHSPGTVTAAQMFAILLNRASGRHAAIDSPSAALAAIPRAA